MIHFLKNRSKKAGAAPGTVVHIGKKREAPVDINVFNYDEQHYEEKKITNVDDLKVYKEKPGVSWVNVDGVHEAGLVENVCKIFDVHPLIAEDIVNTSQRPKMEEYDNHVFFVLNMLTYNDEKKDVDSEQISILLDRNYVLSFQEEKQGDVFDIIRDRIRQDKGKLRKKGPTFLVYALIDAIVDHYFIIMEKIGDDIEDLEESLVNEASPAQLHKLHELKKSLLFLRRSIWPLRELVSKLQRSESEFVDQSVGIYLRDVYDHAVQIIDTLEIYREMLAVMLDTYLSSLSNKMNNVMKVLTMIATIFIPLTFVVGVYGMNFKYMPELDWPYSYPVIWAVMIGVSLVMIYYFKRKKWF